MELSLVRMPVMTSLLHGLSVTDSLVAIWSEEIEPGAEFSTNEKLTGCLVGGGMRCAPVSE